MKKHLIILIIIIAFINCKKTSEQEKANLNSSVIATPKNHAKPDALDLSSVNEIENWKEYSDLAAFLEKFDDISPNDALNNAIQLRDLIKILKESVKPEILDTNAFNSRLNVLENEALRLKDMTYIPAIKAEEVNNQVSKILNVFGSVNQKINTVFAQKSFEDAVKVNGAKLKTTSDTVLIEKKISEKNKFTKKIPSIKKNTPKKLLKKASKDKFTIKKIK